MNDGTRGGSRDFLAGDGELARLMRDRDWSQTPLGPAHRWPRSLKTAVRIMLTSRQPFWIGWGPELIYLYNDPYKSIIGGKHPWALGRPFRDVWSEIRDVVGPMADAVMQRDEGTYVESQRLIMERNGYPEETYYTFSYSPIPNDDGGPGGLICANTDDTRRVIGERQMATLREVAARTANAKSVAQASALAAEALATNARDLPFALLTLGGGLAAASGIDSGRGAALPFERAPVSIGLVDLDDRFGELPRGDWDARPTHAAVIPLRSTSPGGPEGALVAGLNPFRLFDADYRGFLELLSGQIAAALGNAQAYERERLRAESLAELDRAKTAFFSNVSHEFRTPLTLMLGPLEALLDRDTPDRTAQEREQIELVHRNALRLLRLVNSMLDFAQIEAGRMEARYEAVDLPAYTAELASNFRSACERAGLELVIDCPAWPGGETACVDRDMWEKIVLNLLSNAFKYTLEGRIEVRLAVHGDAAQLRVRDTGTGIPAEELPRMFDRFHRIRHARGRTHEGTGIGLALVQELVKLHGGAVRVESTLGAGSLFVVSIPLGSAHLELTPAWDAGEGRAGSGARAYVEEAMRWLPRDPESESGEVAGGTRLGTVLWADDNADMRGYVARLLGGRFDVVAVADGQAALEAALANPPDLVLSDVMMPRLDGFGLLRRIRSEPALSGIPVILLSARAGEDARVEGVGSGADDYLVKPFSARELIARVEAQVRLARFRREAGERLRASEERLSGILGAMSDAFMAFDAGFRFSFVNEQCEKRMGRPRSELIGRSLWELYPDARGNVAHRELQRAMAERTRVEYEVFYEPWQRWFFDKAFPTEDGGLAVYSQDITERKRVETALQDADRRKDEFLAVLSHELRNPLAPISAAVHLLGDGSVPEPVRRSSLDVLNRQVRHVNRLLEDLLDLSRITGGKMSLSRHETLLSAIVQQAIELARPQIDAGRLTLDVHMPAAPVVVHADPVRLAQVFGNLLTNAARHSPRGGRIAIDGRRVGDVAIVAVRDEGVGIAADMLSRIFEMFAQGPAADRTGGLGIGLWLARKLTEMHGGTLEARSDGEGRGAEFTVRLPVHAGRGVAAARAVPAAPVRPRRILVVDDNRDAAEMLGLMLASLGHDVGIAFGGREAIEKALVERPEVMLLDIDMPLCSGLDVARRLRNGSGCNGIRLVALTGLGQSRDRARAFEAGFDEYLVKPVDLEKLGRVLQG